MARAASARALREAVILPTAQGQTLELEWRRGALRAAYLSMALALLAVALVALSVDVRFGALVLATLPFNLLGARLIAAASPRRLQALAIGLLATFFLLTSAATLLRGPTPLSAVAQTVFVVTSGVLLGRRALWVSAALVGLGTAAVGAAFFSGLVQQPDSLKLLDWGLRSTWVRVALGHGVLIAVACAPVLHLLRQFERGALDHDHTLAQQEEERRRLVQAAHERSQSEAAFARAQRARVVGTLGAAVAHGFNDGLVVIRGGAELLCSETATPQERAQAAQEIRDACRRATGLTRKLLSLARPAGHHGAGERPPQDRAEVQLCFDEVARTFAQVLPADIHLAVRVQPGLIARLDAAHLEQVLVNLALNGRDAMPAGGTLTLTAAEAPAPPGATAAAEGWLRLTVEDTGAGIPPEVRARLFEPFFTTKPAGTGAGLGLATSQKIVEAAGGRISLESTPDAGTRAEVLLPAAPRAAVSAAGEPGSSHLKSGRVLLVEPDASVRRVSSLALAARGFSVLEQADVLRALEPVRRQREALDLLCLGVPLSAPGAAALVDELCALHPAAQVLVCSAAPAAAAGAASREPSRFGWLPKPFAAAELAQRAAELFGQRGARP